MALESRLRGTVLRPGDEAYDGARTGFNLQAPHQPDAIVEATDADEVALAVRHAVGRGLPVAVQATGHGQTGALSGGVLVTTGRMDGLEIDPGRRTARIEAGVRWGAVVAAAAEHGLAPLNGSSPGVGAVGYTLAGGLPLLGRTYGWAADHVRWLDVVTWDGRRVRATGDIEPDLFWGLRGGGGALGIVAAMEVDLVPVERVFGGALLFDGDHTGEVMESWLAWTADAPEEITSSLSMMTMPDVPAVPVALRGRDTISVRLAVAGDPRSAETLVEPLRGIAPALADSLRTLPWSDCASITTDPPFAHPYQGTGVALRSLDGDAVASIREKAGPGAPVSTIVQLNHLGGALGRPADVPDAVGHRDAGYLLRLLSVVGEDGPAPLDTAHEAVVHALGRRVLGRSLGFQFGPHPAEQWEACFDPAALSRLRSLLA